MSTLVQIQELNGFSRGTRQKGFSLVELMVVVAIIGILSAVAVPSVNKYMAKARQTEAKANLSMYYGANKVFFTEYGIFDTKFTVIGFKPEGRMRYNVGHTFGGHNLAELQSFGYQSLTALPAVDYVSSGVYCNTPTNGVQYAQAGCRMTSDAAPAVTDGGCVPAPGALPLTSVFTACASGKITNRNVWDSWSIDQNKNLINVQDGTE